jgi:PPOX class probable FMN-dependent enzyme
MNFEQVISSVHELRALMGEPVSPAVVDKTLPALDKHCRNFISRSPFVLIASSDSSGRMDISPKGDAPGFVQVLDDVTLAIPERPGNQRFDTFCNLLESPRLGLIFLIPGKRETLRVSGTAQIVADPVLLESMSAGGKVPALALVVRVEEAFMHCAKCMIRSKLWEPEAWPALDGLPSLAQAMKDAMDFPGPVEFFEERIKDDEDQRLY